MYLSLMTLGIFVAAIFSPLGQRPQARTSAVVPVRSNAIGNGSEVVSLPFPSLHTIVSNLTFSPSGTAYFLNADDEVDSMPPSGHYAIVSPASAYAAPTYGLEAGSSNILYAHQKLWFVSKYGVISMALDGSRRRSYGLGIPGITSQTQSVLLGSDGAIDVFMRYNSYQQGPAWKVYRIDGSGVVTSMTIPYAYVYDVVAGSNGAFYASYSDDDVTYGIALIQADGAITTSPLPYNYALSQMVFTNGNLYYELGATSLVRLASNGVLTSTPLPAPQPYLIPGNLAVDRGGNLWISLDGFSPYNGYSLYQYNVYTRHFNGPYDPSLVNNIDGGIVAVGPDDNVWYATTGYGTSNIGDVAGIGVLVRHT